MASRAGLPVFFAADVHLQESREDITARFLSFLQHIAGTGRALYLLGDIFESWIGDDDPSPLAQTIQAQLKELTSNGLRVFFMPGNRDFLLGTEWLQAAGVLALPDPCLLPEEDTPRGSGGKILLSHGDALCVDDKPYQQIRRQLRDPLWQQQFLAKSLDERRAFAAAARNQSREYVATASDAIMDVNPQAVEALMDQHGADILIHGHTHRPAIHRWESATSRQWRQRLVVGDWHRQASYLRLADDEFRLITC